MEEATIDEKRYYLTLGVIFFYTWGIVWPAFAVVGSVPLTISKVLMVVWLFITIFLMAKSHALIKPKSPKWYSRIVIFVFLLILYIFFMIQFLMFGFALCPTCP